MRLNSSWTCSVLYFKRLIQLLDVIGRLKSLPCEKYLISMHWPFTGPDRRLQWIKLTSLESCPAYRLPIRQINFYSYFWCFRNLQRLYKTFRLCFRRERKPYNLLKLELKLSSCRILQPRIQECVTKHLEVAKFFPSCDKNPKAF